MFDSSPRLRTLLLLAVVVVATSSCGLDAPESSIERPPPPVETIQVEQRSVEEKVDAVGTLTALKSVDLRAQEPGLVRELRDRHAPVETGELLLRLDRRQAAAQVSLARADVAQAEATLRKNRRAHERIGALQGEGVASEQSGDEALAGLEQAKAALEVAQARLIVAEAELAETAILAPFSGHLGRWRVDEGAYVQTGEILNRLTDDRTLEVRFAVPERRAAALAIGQRIRLSVSSHPGEAFDGELTFIEPEIDAATRSAQAIATFANLDRLLRPGQFARVELILSTRHDGLLVPVSSVVTDGDRHYVFVVAAEEATPREVLTGVRVGDWREIREGVGPGDYVIQTGHTNLDLRDPTKVRTVTLEDTRP